MGDSDITPKNSDDGILDAWIQIAIFVGAAILVNIFIYVFGYVKTTMYAKIKSNKWFPPGIIVGLIWIIIFGFLGYSHYLVWKEVGGVSVASVAIIVFAVYALFYPIIAFGRERRAKFMDFFALILAFVVALLVIEKSVNAFYYLIPLLVWASFVNLLELYY